MKKSLMIIAVGVTLCVSAFSASYTNNTYQKLAKEYAKKSEKALDAGEYQLAEEYAEKARLNAEMSDEFIRHMMARENAEKDIKVAKERIEYVKSIHGAENFPMALDAAEKSLAQAEDSFGREDYESASSYAKMVMDTLAEVYEITPLPKYYVVRPWATDRDCFWNISGRPYVYNNPFLWENLYEKNKNDLPKPENPNLILPGMKMEIPSITGEFREGTYSPDVEYEPYKAR